MNNSNYLTDFVTGIWKLIDILYDVQVSSTIHVDPSRVHQVLPMVAASSPLTTTTPAPRQSSKPSRDPRLAADVSRDPRLGIEGTARDPRLTTEGGSRDPRLGVSRPATTTPQTSKTNRDPRVKELDPSKDAKEDKREKEKEKEKKEKEEKKREHHKSKKETQILLSSRSSSQERKKRDSKDKDVLSSSKSKSKSSRDNNKDSNSAASASSSSVANSVSSIPKVSKSDSNSNSSCGHKKSLSPAPPKTPPPTFRSSRSGRHNRKYKPRDSTPESDNETEAGKEREATVVAGGMTAAEGKKNNVEEGGSDSDSDHYEGNRPSPELYNKTGELKLVDGA